MKFEDREAAEQFYERAMESSDMGDTFVRVGFVDESDGNFNSLPLSAFIKLRYYLNQYGITYFILINGINTQTIL